MSFRTRAAVAIISLSTWLAASAQSGKRTNTPVSFNGAVMWRQYNERRAQMNDHESIHAIGQPQAEPRTRTRAQAKITVQSSEATPYDQTASPALMEIRLGETFTRDIDGESPVRALQVLRDDHSACLVSMQRFRGKLRGPPGHLRASRFRNRREWQDQGDMVCRSRIGDRRSFRAARRGRLCGPVWKRVRRNARILVRMM
jgi:hypothetical protein